MYILFRQKQFILQELLFLVEIHTSQHDYSNQHCHGQFERSSKIQHYPQPRISAAGISIGYVSRGIIA